MRGWEEFLLDVCEVRILFYFHPKKYPSFFSHFARHSHSMCSIGHTHRGRAVCHSPQMLSCGIYLFSGILLFLGKTFRQYKENSTREGFWPALWLILAWLVSASCSDLGGLAPAFLMNFVSVFHFKREFVIVLHVSEIPVTI